MGLANRVSFAGQRQERCLKGVLGVLLVAQDTPAHPPNETGVAAEQGEVSVLITGGGETLKQFMIGLSGLIRRDDQAMQLPEQQAAVRGQHRNAPTVWLGS